METTNTNEFRTVIIGLHLLEIDHLITLPFILLAAEPRTFHIKAIVCIIIIFSNISQNIVWNKLLNTTSTFIKSYTVTLRIDEHHFHLVFWLLIFFIASFAVCFRKYAHHLMHVYIQHAGNMLTTGNTLKMINKKRSQVDIWMRHLS